MVNQKKDIELVTLKGDVARGEAQKDTVDKESARFQAEVLALQVQLKDKTGELSSALTTFTRSNQVSFSLLTFNF